MISVIAGLALVIVAVILWFGGLTLIHAMAIFLAIIGILLVLAYAVPSRYYYRPRP